MEKNKIGRTASVIFAVLTIILGLLGPAAIYRSGASKGEIYTYLFFYIIVFLFLFFSSKKSIRVIFLIGGGILNFWMFEEISIGYSPTSSGDSIYVVMCISCLASYIITMIFPRNSGYTTSSSGYSPKWGNVEKAKQNILSGKTCANCRHVDNRYGDCPYEPDARHQRPPCCHKYSE